MPRLTGTVTHPSRPRLKGEIHEIDGKYWLMCKDQNVIGGTSIAPLPQEWARIMVDLHRENEKLRGGK